MPVSWDRKLERLERIPLFDSCSRSQIHAIGRLGDLVTRDAGTVLAEEGRRAAQVLVIVDGTATVSRDGTVHGRLGPGDVVGAVTALARRPRTDTVTADTPIDLLVFDPRSFRGLLTLAPDVSRRVLEGIASRTRAA